MSFFTKCILSLFFITNIGLLSARQLLYIGCVSDDKIYTYDITNSEIPFPLGTIDGIDNPQDIVFSSDAKYAYVTVKDQDQVIRIDTTTNSTVGSPITVGSQPHGMAITPDGQFLYVTSDGSADISVISTETNTVVDTITITASDTYDLVFTPAGKFAYVISYTDMTLHLINTETREEITGNGYPITLSGTPFKVAITPDGQYVYVTINSHGKVAVIDTSDNTVLPLIPVGTAPQSIAITPDNLFAYVTNYDNNAISIIDVVSNTVITDLTDASIVGPTTLAVTPDGMLVYIVDGQGFIHIISTRSQGLVTLKNPVFYGNRSCIYCHQPYDYGCIYKNSQGRRFSINRLL